MHLLVGGKTGLAYQICKQSGLRTLILNNNNVLLDQYIELLEENLEDECISCKGKTNYPCKKDKSKNPANANCIRQQCLLKTKRECEYYKRRDLMNKLQISISNYQLILSCLDSDVDIVPYDLVICDECHNIENIIVDYSTVLMSEEIVGEIFSYINLINNHALPNEKDYYSLTTDKLRDIALSTNISNYKEHFDEFYRNLISLYNRVQDVNQDDYGFLDFSINLINKYNVYKNYTLFVENGQDNFIYEEDYDNKIFKLLPLNIDKMFQDYMSKITKKLVLMSATVINHNNMIHDLGFDYSKTKYIELPSKFPKEHRPIVAMNTARVKITDNNYEQSQDFKDLIHAILEILKFHESRNESGFIYCNSYKLCNMIKNNIEGKTGFEIIMNTKASETKDALRRFLDTSNTKRLLISPSFGEGVNFNDDISRFQIIPKVPYLYLGSQRIATKCRLNGRWYTNKTIENIIQVSGRSVRSEEDEAVTYILDNAFSGCYFRYREDYPIWFDEALKFL